MHRTQVTFADAQFDRLREESAQTGRSLAELLRRALEERYGQIAAGERLRLLKQAHGAWSRRGESGAELLERIRMGTARRLRAGC